VPTIGFGQLIIVVSVLLAVPYLLKVAFMLLLLITCVGAAAVGSIGNEAGQSVGGLIGIGFVVFFIVCFAFALVWPSKNA
jgi:hypothetical protein